MLEGIRIIEIEGLGPAPFAGMMLADLGAEVIVVHRPLPSIAGVAEGSIIDRGKKSIVLDLKDGADVDTLKALADTADGLIEGFRPGVMERLGLGPDELSASNPHLVYGRLTGWGQDGPMAKQAGHDLNYIGLSGLLWYASPAGEAPFTPPTVAGDIGGGAMYLVAGMLAGLLRAARTGKGTVVDAAIVDGSAHMMNLLMSARAAGMLDAARGTGQLDGSPWSRCYRCADGGWLSLQCLEPQFYEIFLEELGVKGDESFERDSDPRTWDALADRISTLIATKSLDEWSAAFEGSDACVAPVLEPSAAAVHPHLDARGVWTAVEGKLQARAAPRFDGRRPENPPVPPRRGQHTAEILASLR